MLTLAFSSHKAASMAVVFFLLYVSVDNQPKMEVNIFPGQLQLNLTAPLDQRAMALRFTFLC